MKKDIRRFWCIGSICLALTCIAHWSNGQSVDALFEDPVLVRHKDFKITRSQLDQEFIIFRNDMEKSGKRLNANLRHVYEKNLLKRMAFARLMIAKAEDDERRQTAQEVDEYVRNNKADASLRAAFDAHILALGLEESEYTAMLKDRMLAEKVLFRLLEPKISVSENEIQSFYDQNERLFEAPPFYKVSHIMFSTRKAGTNQDISLNEMMEKKTKAEEVASLARKGEQSFEELVAQFSEDPRSRANQGVYNFAPGQLDPDFEKVALQMNPGQISDPVKSKYGYHVIKFLEMTPSKKEPLEGKIREDIQKRLRAEKLKEHLDPFQTRIIDENEVEFLTPEK